MTVNITKRNHCRVCGETGLHKWVHLPSMPLTDDLRHDASGNNIFLADIDVYVCTNCQTSQTLSNIDFSSYYEEYSYTVANSTMANNFMSRLAVSVYDNFDLKEGSSVLEVGSGDGNQLSYFQRLGSRVFGFEPSAELCRRSESIGVPVHQGLFDENSIYSIPKEYKNADVVLLTYTFDHIPEPMKFLEAAKKILNSETGVLVMEVHDLEKIVERREYCLFEHEHYVYLHAASMQSLLRRAGFELISVDLLPEQERRGNSLLVAATPFNSKHIEDKEYHYSCAEIDYERFQNNLTQSITKLDHFIYGKVSEGKKIAGYGAGGRGVMTLAAMQSAHLLAYMCDGNVGFHGKWTPKSNLAIYSPDHLTEEPVDIVIVFSFGYYEEIRHTVVERLGESVEVVSLLEIL